MARAFRSRIVGRFPSWEGSNASDCGIGPRFVASRSCRLPNALRMADHQALHVVSNLWTGHCHPMLIKAARPNTEARSVCVGNPARFIPTLPCEKPQLRVPCLLFVFV